MLPDTFHFAMPFWLWGLIALPVLWALYALLYKPHNGGYNKLKDFADPHLLPHLLENDKGQKLQKRGIWRSLLIWSLIWAGAMLAMAGPRWEYTQVKAFAPARSLIMVLDLSRSMDAQDIKPSRLIRARQEIEDILRLGDGVKFGLVAFDAAAHMITPLSDDVQTIKQLLPSLTTEIVYTQGANLSPALEMAGNMLKNAQGKEKHILILSDGEFNDSDATILRAEKKLRAQGVQIHVMGLGTTQGAPIPDGKKGLIKDNGAAVISKLEEAHLRRIASDGGGLYLKASYLDHDVRSLLSRIQTLGTAEKEAQKTTQFWEEHFYIFLLPLVFLVLPWFRRGAVFPALIAVMLMMQSSSAQAFEWKDLFLNKAQKGQRAVQEQKFDQALEQFDDPYRKGVVQYKAGDYEAASRFFKQTGRGDVRYNLGNAQLMGGKIEEAIQSYETLLKDRPDHEDAKHNLDIAKKLLEQQKQQDQSQDQSQKDQKQDQQDSTQKGDQGEEGKGSDRKGEDQKRKDKEQSGEQGDEDSLEKQVPEDKSQKTEPQEKKEEDKAENKSDKERKDNKSNASEDSNEEQQKGTQDDPVETQSKPRTQKDINADQWLNRVKSNPNEFLKNKFYIESKRAGAQKGVKSW